MKRETINYITNDESDRILLAHIYDIATSVKENQYIQQSYFLSPNQITYVKKLFAEKNSPDIFIWGGYDDAERCICMILPDYIDSTEVKDDIINFDNLSYLRIFYPKFRKLFHSDFLGALMNLNIKRELIGDILVSENSCDLICSKSIENFITMNLKKVATSPVTIDVLNNYKELIVPNKELYIQKKIISSFRIDTFVSSAYNLSREKAQNMILSGLVTINDTIIYKPTKLVEIDDKINLRKHGKLKFNKVVSKTKKDNYLVEIAYYKKNN